MNSRKEKLGYTHPKEAKILASISIATGGIPTTH